MANLTKLNVTNLDLEKGENTAVRTHCPIPRRENTYPPISEYAIKLSQLSPEDLKQAKKHLRSLHSSIKRLRVQLQRKLLMARNYNSMINSLGLPGKWLHILDVVNTFELLLLADFPIEVLAGLHSMHKWGSRAEEPNRSLACRAYDFYADMIVLWLCPRHTPEKVEEYCKGWGGAAAVYKVYDSVRVKNLEACRERFWFLMVPLEELDNKMVFIGDDRKVYPRDIVYAMYIAALDPMRRMCEEAGWGKPCWKNVPRKPEEILY